MKTYIFIFLIYSLLLFFQSQCTSGDTPPPSPSGKDISDIITRSQFEDMLKHRNHVACPARGFYTYDAFIIAARYFPDFGTTGDTTVNEKEVAAFFGQTSHETTGGWPTAPDGPFTWGYCFKEEMNPPSIYCSPSDTWPCERGKSYKGRGPMQLAWNYNYGPCGEAIGVDLLSKPELLSEDAVISFKSAIWYWMTPQGHKPSCHDVIVEQWKPSFFDLAAGRSPGYGMITNVINGGFECGIGPNEQGEDRIGFYKKYCNIIGVDPGDDLDCYYQMPFGTFRDAAI